MLAEVFSSPAGIFLTGIIAVAYYQSRLDEGLWRSFAVGLLLGALCLALTGSLDLILGSSPSRMLEWLWPARIGFHAGSVALGGILIGLALSALILWRRRRKRSRTPRRRRIAPMKR